MSIELSQCLSSPTLSSTVVFVSISPGAPGRCTLLPRTLPPSASGFHAETIPIAFSAFGILAAIYQSINCGPNRRSICQKKAMGIVSAWKPEAHGGRVLGGGRAFGHFIAQETRTNDLRTKTVGDPSRVVSWEVG